MLVFGSMSRPFQRAIPSGSMSVFVGGCNWIWDGKNDNHIRKKKNHERSEDDNANLLTPIGKMSAWWQEQVHHIPINAKTSIVPSKFKQKTASVLLPQLFFILFAAKKSSPLTSHRKTQLLGARKWFWWSMSTKSIYTTNLDTKSMAKINDCLEKVVGFFSWVFISGRR